MLFSGHKNYKVICTVEVYRLIPILTTEKQGWDAPTEFGFQNGFSVNISSGKFAVIVLLYIYWITNLYLYALLFCSSVFLFLVFIEKIFRIFWSSGKSSGVICTCASLRGCGLPSQRSGFPVPYIPFKKNCKFISWRKWEISNLQILKFLLEEVPVLDFLFLSTQEEAPFYGNPISRKPPYPEKPISEKQVEKWEKTI